MNDSTKNSNDETIETVHIKREQCKMLLVSVNLVPHATAHSILFASPDETLAIAVTPAALVGLSSSGNTLQFPIAVIAKDGRKVDIDSVKAEVFDCFAQLGVNNLVDSEESEDDKTVAVDLGISLDHESEHTRSDGNCTFGIVEVYAASRYIELCKSMQAKIGIAASMMTQRAQIEKSLAELEARKPTDTVH